MKKKLLMAFESPRERYRAEATVLWCLDDRFSLALQVLAERMGWKNYDLIRVAGGVKSLSNMDNDDCPGTFLLKQIEKSVRDNRSPEVFLMTHYNCPSYGHEQMEPTSEEDRFLATELSRAGERVSSYLKMVGAKADVRLLLVDFKNVYEVDV